MGTKYSVPESPICCVEFSCISSEDMDWICKNEEAHAMAIESGRRAIIVDCDENNPETETAIHRLEVLMHRGDARFFRDPDNPNRGLVVGDLKQGLRSVQKLPYSYIGYACLKLQTDVAAYTKDLRNQRHYDRLIHGRCDPVGPRQLAR